jgi:hypothetical protein
LTVNQVPTEADTRLPTGEWTGFYLEDHQPRRGWMHLYLSFSDNSVRGEGADYVGPWTISGSYDLETSVIQWVKQYVGKHQVHYRGRITANGIEGGWDIRNWNNGLFHIWPRHRFELENLYLQEDLAGLPPTILAGTVPLPRTGET